MKKLTQAEELRALAALIRDGHAFKRREAVTILMRAADLIEAAPDLLDACKVQLGHLRQVLKEFPNDFDVERGIQVACAAIEQVGRKLK